MGMFEHCFDFSVITVADSAISEDAAKSVGKFVNNISGQTMEFDKIQIIFVCGSDRDALAQVKKQKKKYPKSISVVKVKTLDFGAYQTALQKATGKYVAFPELSARYSKKAFKSVKEFFKENSVPLVKLPVFLKKGDDKTCVDRAYLTKPKTVSLEENIKYATLDLNSCFFVRGKLDDISKPEFALNLQLKKGELGINSKAGYNRTVQSGSEISKFFDLDKMHKLAEKEGYKGEAALSAMTKFAYENGIEKVRGEHSAVLNEKLAEFRRDKEYDYKVSVVIPVYKVEKYVEETFASIRRQNIGFFENIQVIFVDDGSPDKSGEICDKIAKKYPYNVICVHKENGGVSSARNMGIDYATGKYINFCDPDDYFKYKATFSSVCNFMEEHSDEVDFVTIPLRFFEAKKGPHMLNGKFAAGTRVIDLNYEPQYIQLHVTSSFFKRDVIRRYKFKTSLKISEDAELITELVSEKMKYGVCDNLAYMIRKRDDNSSALQGSVSNPAYYKECMTEYLLYLVDYFKNKFGYIPDFFKYVIAYEMQWRISYSKNLNTTILSDAEAENYLNNLKKAISYVDDEIIVNNPQANFERKYKTLELKGTLKPHTEYVWRNPDGYRYVLMSGDYIIGDYSKNPTKIYNIDIIKDQLIIEGVSSILHGQFNKTELYLTLNDAPIKTEHLHEADYCSDMLGEPVFDNITFRVKIPLDDIKRKSQIRIVMKCDDIVIHKTNISYYHLCKVNNKFRNQYYFKNGYMLFASGSEITVQPADKEFQSVVEAKLQNEIMKTSNERKEELVSYRQEYFKLKPLKTKPIWLISDRIIKADDNGKAFFKYVMENHADEVDTYFVLDHNSVDYKELSEIGPVLDYGSHEHLIKVLLADKFISSAADENVINPFGKGKSFVRGLMDFDFIFLQHGVTKDNISGWLGKFKKDIKGFITSAKAEEQSIINGAGYNYEPKNVWLTGMPRFDLLYHNEQNYITLMPTWRKYLLTDYDYSTGKREATDKLKNSEYVKFYSDLMCNSKLLAAAKKYGYKIKFMPHPGMIPIVDVFTWDKEVELFDFDVSYHDVYAKSNLIITDYSSAVFDFSYLGKPIIYCQFDKDSFFSGDHVYTKGYFDYERDGFGEVEYDLDSTVDRIIEYMQNGCKLKDKYRERIDNFFAFNDKGSCERIYNKIIDMDK